MRPREIFRYNCNDLSYIAEISNDPDFIPPKNYSNATSIWINLHITKTSAKRNGREIRRDGYHDGRYEMHVDNGLSIALELRKRFREWIRRYKPEFLTIAAYRDGNEKRLRIYEHFFKSEGYDLYSIDKSELCNHIYYFCRNDLDFKRKRL